MAGVVPFARVVPTRNTSAIAAGDTRTVVAAADCCTLSRDCDGGGGGTTERTYPTADSDIASNAAESSTS